MSSMKFALHWKRPKKGYSSFQKAVFYRQEDVIWYINVLKEQGIEDYELLEKLKLKNSNKHKRLIKKLFLNYTNYSLSINKYQRIRKKLLKSI